MTTAQIHMYEYECFIQPVMERFDRLGILPHTKPNAIGMWPNEQECLLWTAFQSQLDSDWIEVGSFCGGSTVLLGMAKEHRQGSVVAIDTAFNPMFDLNIRRSGLTNIVKEQEDSIKYIMAYDGEPISFAFLDGWHSFKNVVCEFEELLPHLTDDAIIGFHDVSPKMWTNSNQTHIRDCNEYAIDHYEQLIFSTEQDFRIDEAIAYICTKHNYQIIDIPIRQPLEYHRETGLSGWVRGRTSPHNAFTAIRKIK